jgi:hypothetical protein
MSQGHFDDQGSQHTEMLNIKRWSPAWTGLLSHISVPGHWTSTKSALPAEQQNTRRMKGTRKSRKR